MAKALRKASKVRRALVREVPWDNEPVTPGDEAAIEEGRRAFRQGRYVTLQEWKRELESARNRPRSKRR